MGFFKFFFFLFSFFFFLFSFFFFLFPLIVSQADEVAGSPHWMAPEVVLEKVLLSFPFSPHLLLIIIPK